MPYENFIHHNDDKDDYRLEMAQERAYRRRFRSCTDRMCGALDCPRCSPQNFQGGRYLLDDECFEKGEE